MKRTENVYTPRAADRKIKPPPEPKKLRRGTVVEVCADDPALACRATVRMSMPGARVEVIFPSGGILVVARSMVTP